MVNNNDKLSGEFVMKRHIVCLTFDFDAQSAFIAKNLTTPTFLSRGEFGEVGAQRILALLKKYNILGTWFIPGVTIEAYPKICDTIVAHDHEIAHHGWTHTPPAALSREKELEDLMRANDTIRRLSGEAAVGYRSPSWDLSDHTVELLLNQNFLYDSSMMGNDYTPYFARIGDVVHPDQAIRFGKPSQLLEMPISWSTDDYPHFEYVRTQESVSPGLKAASGVLENWINDYIYMQHNLDWGILTYTFHPFCTGRGHRMIILEELIKSLTEKNAVFMPLKAAAKEFKDLKPLKPN